MDQAERKDRAQHALVYVGVGAAILALLVLLWYAIDVVLLVFFGVLLAALLRAPAEWLARRSGLKEGWSLAIVMLALAALLAASGVLFGRAVITQSTGLAEQLPQAWQKVRERLESSELGRRAAEAIEGSSEQQDIEFLGRGLRVVGSTLAALGSLVVVVFLALFLALNPQAYVEGLLTLVVPRRRRRAREVLDALGHVLKRWLLGQVALMLLVGALTGIGLAVLGVPFALPLALAAGLLEFVPYFGPIVATVPALLVGLAESPELALWVAALYFGVQILEGYVLTPLIQHRAVRLPPALILLSQVLMGVTAGPLGVIVATPLAAVTLVAVRMLYVEDMLGDRAV